jgi:hypothetical protein
MAKVHDCLEMWQGSQNLCDRQKESCTHNKQMTATGYVLYTEEISEASWSLFQHDGTAAFTLSERTPSPQPLSAKDLPGGWTQILNVCWFRWINSLPVEIADDSTPESISDFEDWLTWNGDLHNPNDSDDDCTADIESDLKQDHSIKDPECPEQRYVNAAPNVPKLIQPTWKSKWPDE